MEEAIKEMQESLRKIKALTEKLQQIELQSIEDSQFTINGEPFEKDRKSS